MRTVLICHEGAELTSDGLARWLASFSELAGILLLREPAGETVGRIRRELRRSGLFGFLDVLAFRAYARLALADSDRRLEKEALHDLRQRYPPVPDAVARLRVESPNSPEAAAFLRACAPDLVLARCKMLIRESIFSIPARGTFVLHPGICPEYRNSHGCFWALARGETDKVGMTLLRIDRGVDTGPVFGYFTYPYDEGTESHVTIQRRVVLENLPAIQAKLLEIGAGTAAPISTEGRPSAVWGQPRLTSFWKWKRRVRRAAA